MKTILLALLSWILDRLTGRDTAEKLGQQEQENATLKAQNAAIKKQRDSLAHHPTDKDVEDALNNGTF